MSTYFARSQGTPDELTEQLNPEYMAFVRRLKNGDGLIAAVGRRSEFILGIQTIEPAIGGSILITAILNTAIG